MEFSIQTLECIKEQESIMWAVLLSSMKARDQDLVLSAPINTDQQNVVYCCCSKPFHIDLNNPARWANSYYCISIVQPMLWALLQKCLAVFEEDNEFIRELKRAIAVTWRVTSLMRNYRNCCALPQSLMFLLNFISSRDGPERVQRQGRVERKQEDYPASAKKLQQMEDSFLAFFHLCLVPVLFQVHPYLKWSFAETFSLVFFLKEFLNQVSNRTGFEIVSAIHSRLRYHSAEELIHH